MGNIREKFCSFFIFYGILFRNIFIEVWKMRTYFRCEKCNTKIKTKDLINLRSNTEHGIGARCNNCKDYELVIVGIEKV